MWHEFKEFLIKQNAVALAIAVVIGVALNTVVQAIVNDLIMPIIGVIKPSGDWSKQIFNVGPVHLGVGDLASALLNFAIVGFVCWRISKIFVKTPPKGPPTTKSCNFCKTTIDIGATRCPNCTSQLSPA
ncbi:MAG TPA: MscL family protein [Gemmatimonadaceae bacterium]